MVGRGGVSSSALGWESRRIVGVTRRRAALAVVVEAAGGGGGGDLGVTRRPGKELVRFSSVEEEEEEEEEVEWEEAAEGVWALGAKVTVEEDGGESMVRGEEGEGGVEGSKEEEEEVASGSSGAGGLGGGGGRGSAGAEPTAAKGSTKPATSGNLSTGNMSSQQAGGGGGWCV